VLIVRGLRVITGNIERPATVHIEEGRITRVGGYDELQPGAETIDAGRLVVSPGIIDTHVHVNEPGRTDWEGFDTATRAAAAGGVTTIVDMPLNSVPATTTVDALEEKRRAATGQCHVDVGFWGGVVPGNDRQLDTLVDAGVRGFKCFLVPSGVDEFQEVGESHLRRAMPILARRNVPLLVHAESPAHLVAASDLPAGPPSQGGTGSPPQRYATYLATRPPEAEIAAVRLMAALAAEFNVRTHIVHVAAAGAVEEIARARARGVPLTAETCPHYLMFSEDDIPDGATAFKCAPPIRGRAHRDALWNGLGAGTLDLIATDHSPSPPALKCGQDFLRAWGGIASLELSLAATWTGASARGLMPVDLARWMAAGPAALSGIGERKGAIAEGKDADLVLWDPDAEFTVDPEHLQQRHKFTAYAGRRLRGRVRTTIVRGERVWHEGRLGRGASGRLL
jgi:allantoinase